MGGKTLTYLVTILETSKAETEPSTLRDTVRDGERVGYVSATL